MYLKAIPERTCIGCNEKKQKKRANKNCKR